MLFLFVGGSYFYLRYLYLFTYTGVKHDFHIRSCSERFALQRGIYDYFHETYSIRVTASWLLHGAIHIHVYSGREQVQQHQKQNIQKWGKNGEMTSDCNYM